MDAIQTSEKSPIPNGPHMDFYNSLGPLENRSEAKKWPYCQRALAGIVYVIENLKIELNDKKNF